VPTTVDLTGVSRSVSRAVFGLLFESSSEVLLVLDRRTGCILCANAPAGELLASDLHDLEGRCFDDLQVEARDIRNAGHYEEIGLVRTDSYPVFVELDVVHVDHPEHGPLAAVIARDTTERRNLQLDLQLKHSALIAAHAELEARNQQVATLAWRAGLAELVAGIAHHLNNPVAALSSTVARASRRVTELSPEPGDTRAELERLLGRITKIAARIEHNVGEIVAITHQVSRGGPSAMPPELANDVSAFVKRLDDIPTKEKK